MHDLRDVAFTLRVGGEEVEYGAVVPGHPHLPQTTARHACLRNLLRRCRRLRACHRCGSTLEGFQRQCHTLAAADAQRHQAASEAVTAHGVQ